MTTISARAVLRSRNLGTGDVLSTLLLRYPRFIHAEMMTHRAFSRNAASSRAIPVKKMIEDVTNDPVVPLHWGKNQKGMQAGEDLSPGDQQSCERLWDEALKRALDSARWLAGMGLHKQIVNRVLEPFAHITVLVSATEWDNFLALRDHDDAEPHLRDLARCIRGELAYAPVQDLRPGEWHLPFITDADWDARMVGPASKWPGQLDGLRRISVACCASTSYKTVDGFAMTQEKAQDLYDKLAAGTPFHASPFEHVATAAPGRRNFKGFRQWREIMEGGA